MNWRCKFLGYADGAGIPVHGCTCQTCESQRSLDSHIYATSAYLESDESLILLDANGYDTIFQLPQKPIVALFLTHFHPDHAVGLLRLRYAAHTFHCYHPFDPNGFADLYKLPKSIIFSPMRPFEPIAVSGLLVTAVPLEHSKPTMGYIIEGTNVAIAYLTDTARISEETESLIHQKKCTHIYLDGCSTPNSALQYNHLSYIDAIEILKRFPDAHGRVIHYSHETLEHCRAINPDLLNWFAMDEKIHLSN